MTSHKNKTVKEQPSRTDARALYELVADVSQYALALARTYENRVPRRSLPREGRPHVV